MSSDKRFLEKLGPNWSTRLAESLPQALKEIRKQQNITQKTLAATLSRYRDSTVEQPYVSRIENGEICLSMRRLLEWSHALDTDFASVINVAMKIAEEQETGS